MTKVYWAVGLPSLARWWEVDMLMMVARHTRPEYIRLRQPFPIRVNRFRAQIIRQFMELTTDPKDRLVLLDIDHDHPPQIVNLLADPDRVDLPVHMSLSFKRSREEPLALAMNYHDGFKDNPYHVTGWEKGEILECDRGGTTAFCVQRWVFERLLALPGIGLGNLFEYRGNEDCDKHFAALCSEIGVSHYVNTEIVSPHLLDYPEWIGLAEFDAWAKAHGQPGVPLPFGPTKVGTTSS